MRGPFRSFREAAAGIKGNARACVFLEPFFAISNTMYAGYMTLYMLELGMTVTQVGMITSLGLAVHIFFALISPYITDKFGRRRTSLVFDLTGWGLAQLIWAIALDMRFFVAAAVVNASFRVVANSWYCLMLEDSESEVRVSIFNFIQIAAIIGGFFTPVGAYLISRMTLVPAMRVMLIFGTVSMTAFFIVRHFLTTETAVGVRKMEEMKGVRVRDVFVLYGPALKRILSDRLLITALMLRALNFIQMTVRTTFLAVLVTEALMFPAEAMAVFHIVSAAVMLVTILFIAPKLARVTRRWPIILGIIFHIAAIAALLLSPSERNYPLLIVSAAFVALGTGVATPRIEAMYANTLVNEDRSLTNAVMAVIILVLSTPFGYIGGVLSGIGAHLPFLLIIAIFLLCLVTLFAASFAETDGAVKSKREDGL